MSRSIWALDNVPRAMYGFYLAENVPAQLKIDYRSGDLSGLTWVVD